METTIDSEKVTIMRERQQLNEEISACERERKAVADLKMQLYEERRLFDRETQALTAIGAEVRK